MNPHSLFLPKGYQSALGRITEHTPRPFDLPQFGVAAQNRSAGETQNVVTIRTAVISLQVMVPVLSEQITDTEHSVSTAGSRRTIAF